MMRRDAAQALDGRCDAVLDYKTTLRRLALRDDRYIEALLAREGARADESGLDARTSALVQIGALVAVDAAPPSYMSVAENALQAGAAHEDLVGSLIVVMPVVGVARVVSAAPNLALSIGYDVGDALEAVEPAEDAGSENGAVA
jgi:alkylhydroperoxidase/carboxymuconolactone decarboxylase family protein YurZ